MKMLTEMSGRLQDNDWLAGDGWSLAEACLLPYVERLHRMGLAPMWADLPGIAAWYDRVRARPSYERGIAAYPPPRRLRRPPDRARRDPLAGGAARAGRVIACPALERGGAQSGAPVLRCQVPGLCLTAMSRKIG